MALADAMQNRKRYATSKGAELRTSTAVRARKAQRLTKSSQTPASQIPIDIQAGGALALLNNDNEEELITPPSSQFSEHMPASSRTSLPITQIEGGMRKHTYTRSSSL